MPHQASVETGSCELRNAVLQAAEDIVERKQRPPPKFDDHRFLHGSEHRALGIARPHRRIRGRRPRPPFGNGRPAQAITAGEATGRLFRRLELGSNSRRRPGAAVKNVCHSASSDSRVRIAPRLSGTEHLERQIGAFVEHYNQVRYHESIKNLTPADVYFGRAETILAERKRIKLATIANRRLQHRLHAA